jgi:pilus assembly protein Flp/PilA
MLAFLKNEQGATAIEYGLIAGLMTVCLVFGMQIISSGLLGDMQNIANILNQN